jgi:geranylgeranyl diphosphate synthase type II
VTSTADRADLVAEVDAHLRGVARVVRRAMLDAMPDGEPVQWLYGPMREYPSRPGKALRPALCLSASRAFGAEHDAVMGIAVAIELLHNAFLVHDDIADGSEMRRGRPTLAATHGMAAALNAGDGLAIIAGQVLRKATRRLDGDRLAARQCRGPAARRLPRTDHAQDMLVHHDPSAPRRRIGGFGR